MSDCKKLDPLVTPYVDGQLDRDNRSEVDAHLRVCPPCQARVVVEQSVRSLLSARREALTRECASASLRARCGDAALLTARARDNELARLKPRATGRDVARGLSLASC